MEDVRPFLGESSAEIGGWMEGVRYVLKVSELNNSVIERACQDSLRGQYEVWRGGEVESVEIEFIWTKKICTQLFDMKFHRGGNEC